MHIAEAVAQRTPLPTVLFLETASTAASDHAALSCLSENFLITDVTNFNSLGKRNASAPTAESMQSIAAKILCLKMNVTIASARHTSPNTNVDLLNLYSVSLLSKIMSLIDVLSALRIAFKGMRHSMRTAPMMTPAKSAHDNDGISKTLFPLPSSNTNMTFIIGFLTRA